MAEQGFGFDADSVKRIQKSVRRVERTYPNAKEKRGRRVPGPARRILLGKTDAAISKSNSGTISIYAGATKGSESDTGDNRSAYNRFADIAISKWVLIAWVGSGWEIIQAEC